MGYSIQRTVTINRVIENLQVQYNDIDLHVMLCMMTMDRLHLTKKKNYEILTMINKIPIIKTLLVDVVSQSSLYLIDCIYQALCSSIGEEAVNSIFSALANLTQTKMSKFEQAPMWNNLAKLIYRTPYHEVRQTEKVLLQ